MFVNIYNSTGKHFIKLFKTREEADIDDVFERCVEAKHANGATTQITTYCKRIRCLGLEDYIMMDSEREAILRKAQECKANKRLYASLMESYNHFWTKRAKR